MLIPGILTPHKSEVRSSGKQKCCPHLRNPTGFPNMEDNMDVKDIFKSQERSSCLRDLSENGDGLIHLMASVTAGKAEECCSKEVGSCPANVITSHADNCCCHREDSASGQFLADVQVDDNPATPLPTDTLILGQADAPATGDHRYHVKDGSDNPATVGGVYPEQIPNASDGFDDDLEYFECSDVLTVHEDEIWKKKLQFLLESDDEDDLKLSKDCDGCAYFLGEMPCPIQVSDDTTPMDTTIGFCGHHSKLKGVNVRRDPSTSSQSTLQPEMTLAVGHHRDSSSSLQDKEKSKVPEASAPIGNDHSRAEEGNNGSSHSAAEFPRDTSKHKDNVHAEADSAGGRGAAVTKQAPDTMAESKDKDLLGVSSLLLEEEGGAVPQENPRHTVCTLTESLRINLFKLLNPKELCRYVTAIGQSLQAAAEGREPSALGQEGVTATGRLGEAEGSQMQPGVCAAEEGERKRTWGLSEHNQVPAETDSPGKQGADVQISTQSCERLCMEPQMEKKGIFGTCESAGAIQPAPETHCTERTSQAKSDNVQMDSQHHAHSEKGGSCHQQVFCEQGMNVVSGGVSPFPVQDVGSAPDKQECLCAVLSFAKLRDEPREGRQQCSFDSHGSNDTDTFCSLSSDESVLEAQTKSGLECGEPVCRDADISAVHDKLWQLLHEDEESDCQIPCETRGITSLEIRLTGTKVPELHCAQKTSSDPPLPEKQEPVTQPDSRQRTEEGDCTDSSILLKADGASTGNTCLAKVVEADGVCLDSSTGNKPKAPSSICVTANSIILNPGECLAQEPNPMSPNSSGSIQMAVAGGGELPISHASQACDTGSPGRLKDAQSGDRDKETPDKSHGTVGQLLPTEHNISLMDETITARRCHSRDCYPAREELPDFPEDKAFFPSGNTNQLPHEEPSSVNTLPESYGVSSPEKGNHSALNAQSSADPDSDLPSRNDCQDSQVVSNAQENVTVIATPESITLKNPPQTTDQLPEVETQGVAFTPSPGDVVSRDLNVELCKAEQREIGRTGAPCASGAGHASGSQAAAVPRSTSERLGFGNSPFKSGGELKAEPIKWKHNTAKSGHVAAGAKKKLPPASLSKKPRLEEGGDACRDPACATKPVRNEAGVSQREDRNEQRKLTVKKVSKAPKLLKGIQAELFPDCSGNIKLCCQFGDIHSDSTITWTKDSKLLARLQRSAQDDSPVSLAIAKASNKDQGMYYCCLNNMHGKVTAEFNLTSEVLEHLSSFQNCEGMEEIEFMQLMFREDFISDSYFGGNLHGVIATEELHFGEGMHRKAFRSRVMQGLVPVFSPGHPCVLKVHNAITYGTKSQDDLVEKNYNLALQECYVQNTAREYAKIYAAEAEPLEGFGEVPEIIPIFLVHRPANNIPYATVEEELVGEFVKYSVRDGKEVNFLRRDSEAGQKCCTFQHWVYEKTNGSLLVTDLQGVGMKLTDVGIATLAKGDNSQLTSEDIVRPVNQENRVEHALEKDPGSQVYERGARHTGYKGFKGNCSFSFIEQFRALHQCNKYCEMLGLKSLRTSHQKQRKATAMRNKTLPNSSSMKKTVPKKAREPRDFIASEH